MFEVKEAVARIARYYYSIRFLIGNNSDGDIEIRITGTHLGTGRDAGASQVITPNNISRIDMACERATQDLICLGMKEDKS